MAVLKEIKEIKNNGDIQHLVNRTLYSMEDTFSQIDLLNEVKDKLKELGVKQYIINSFMLRDMVRETVDTLVEKGDIIHNGDLTYVYIKDKERKVSYTFT